MFVYYNSSTHSAISGVIVSQVQHVFMSLSYECGQLGQNVHHLELGLVFTNVWPDSTWIYLMTAVQYIIVHYNFILSVHLLKYHTTFFVSAIHYNTVQLHFVYAIHYNTVQLYFVSVIHYNTVHLKF